VTLATDSEIEGVEFETGLLRMGIEPVFSAALIAAAMIVVVKVGTRLAGSVVTVVTVGLFSLFRRGFLA